MFRVVPITSSMFSIWSYDQPLHETSLANTLLRTTSTYLWSDLGLGNTDGGVINARDDEPFVLEWTTSSRDDDDDDDEEGGGVKRDRAGVVVDDETNSARSAENGVRGCGGGHIGAA